MSAVTSFRRVGLENCPAGKDGVRVIVLGIHEGLSETRIKLRIQSLYKT